MQHAQQVGLSMVEIDALDHFITTYAWREGSILGSALKNIKHPLGNRLLEQLARRSFPDVPDEFIRTSPKWELVRTIVSKAIESPIPSDLIWDHMSRKFDELVARQYVPRTDSVQMFEYTALQSFRVAKENGIARIIHVPSLDNLEFEKVQRREREKWPDLSSPSDGYFAAKFAERYDRRREELELAEVVITNSTLTTRSHIEAGVDSRKVFTVPLGAPKPVDINRLRWNPSTGQLRVIWAGSFSLRKGAHYVLDAWRRIKPESAARLEVYGGQHLPERFLATSPDNVIYKGSVSRPELFEAYLSADVLIFPSLSDGFGMVITEALAHGVPVISTDRAGASDLLDRTSGILIPAADSDALFDALQWCLDNREQLAGMRIHALNAARRRQWSDFRQDLILALDEGLNRAGYTPGWIRS